MSEPATTLPEDSTSKARLRLWLRFLKASRAIEAQIRDNLRREFASTLPRFDVMAALSRYSDGLKMSQLSEVLRVSNGNVTGIVDRLVEDGFLVRIAVPNDRRAWRVCLTDKGEKEFAAQAAAHESWINEMLGEFGEKDAATIAIRLEQLETSLREKKQ